MPIVRFTPNLRRHIGDHDGYAEGRSVREALDHHFHTRPHIRGYVLDDQGALRRHMNILVGSAALKDRTHLSDPVEDDTVIYVLQSLSGG